MSFHFRKLILKDWLVYGGTETLRFGNSDSGRNLIIVHGQNGFGKTSLLRAMQFLFHNGLSRDEYFECWNDQAKQKKEGSLEVGLEFIHNGSLCKLTRIVEFKPWGSGISIVPRQELWIDGQQILDQVEDKVAQIIPKETQQFVFFDGAEITRYAHKQYTDGVKEAIELVLGIPAARNLRDDLDKLVRDLESEQTEILYAQGKNTELIAEIEKLEDERSNYLSRKQTLIEQQTSIQQTLTELEKEASQIQLIEVEREKLTEKEQRRAELKERLAEINEALTELLQKAPRLMLANPLAQIVAEYNAKQGAPSPRTDVAQKIEFIEDLLDSTDCICGRPIDHSVEPTLLAELHKLKHILAQYAEVQKNAGSIRELGELSGILRELRSRGQDGQQLIDRRATIEDQLEEIETDIRKLKEKLEHHSTIEVQELFQQQRLLNDQLVDTKAQIQVLDTNIERTEGKLREFSRQRDQLATSTERGEHVTATLETTRRLHAAVDEYVESLVLEKRRDIERETSRIFTSITNKPVEYAGVHVNEDYTLAVYRCDGSIVENTKLSAGEKEVLAYSFITALNISSLNPAPFVMDTPFGHLDSGHREGLLKSLPRLNVQVFLLATDRDLPLEEREKIQHSIAQEFEIRRQQEKAISHVEEVM